MIDIPPDIMHAAYLAAADAKIPPRHRETAVLVAAQLTTAERARALGHVAAAKAALAAAGDGSVTHLQEVASTIIEHVRIAILSGDGL